MAKSLELQLNNTVLAEWTITEPEDVLLSLAKLSNEEKNIYSQLRNSNRKKEWLATRALVNEILGKKKIIYKKENGAPILDDKKKISVSHSGGYVTVLISTKSKIGIDIEKIDRPIEKVAKRFLSNKEQQNCAYGNSQLKWICHWCAKEAIFKAMQEGDVDFANQIEISELIIEADKATAHWSFKHHSGESTCDKIDFIFRNNHCIAWLVM